mmetsp:Transcript_27095/g.58769  ORF Transcript_27095/g.58769 Transcript_27095/m.58769 type:complete len:265 (+) Transcript_27095:292-1086(+)
MSSLRTRRVIDSRTKLGLVPLRYAQNHHVVLDGGAVQVIKSHVLRNGQGGRILKLRRFVEDDMSQMRRQRRRLLGVLVEIGHRYRKDLPVPILGSGGDLAVGILHICTARFRPAATSSGWDETNPALGRLPLPLKVSISDVGLEVGNVNEVVDPTLNVGHGGLIGGEAPLVVHNELEGMLPPLEVVDVGEVIAGAVHGDLTGPAVERSRYVNLPPPVLPAEDRGDGIVVVELGQGGNVKGFAGAGTGTGGGGVRLSVRRYVDRH